MTATYKAIELSGPGKFSEVTKPLLDPGPGHVRIRVEACGVCHSDAATVEALFPINWPRVRGMKLWDASMLLVSASRAGRWVNALVSDFSPGFAAIASSAAIAIS
jgi:Alcohol dehydrogenase GroES-like domain